MAKDTKFIDLLEQRIKLSIHTTAPARVISYNESKRTADVELLFMSVDQDDNAEKYKVIEGVPVQGMRYKIPESFKAAISSLIPTEGSIDGSNASVKIDNAIEFTPFLKKDDVVVVSFAERALDNLNGIKTFDPEFHRTHDINDCIVLGVLF